MKGLMDLAVLHGLIGPPYLKKLWENAQPGENSYRALEEMESLFNEGDLPLEFIIWTSWADSPQGNAFWDRLYEDLYSGEKEKITAARKTLRALLSPAYIPHQTPITKEAINDLL